MESKNWLSKPGWKLKDVSNSAEVTLHEPRHIRFTVEYAKRVDGVMMLGGAVTVSGRFDDEEQSIRCLVRAKVADDDAVARGTVFTLLIKRYRSYRSLDDTRSILVPVEGSLTHRVFVDGYNRDFGYVASITYRIVPSPSRPSSSSPDDLADLMSNLFVPRKRARTRAFAAGPDPDSDTDEDAPQRKSRRGGGARYTVEDEDENESEGDDESESGSDDESGSGSGGDWDMGASER